MLKQNCGGWAIKKNWFLSSNLLFSNNLSHLLYVLACFVGSLGWINALKRVILTCLRFLGPFELKIFDFLCPWRGCEKDNWTEIDCFSCFLPNGWASKLKEMTCNLVYPDSRERLHLCSGQLVGTTYDAWPMTN